MTQTRGKLGVRVTRVEPEVPPLPLGLGAVVDLSAPSIVDTEALLAQLEAATAPESGSDPGELAPSLLDMPPGDEQSEQSEQSDTGPTLLDLSDAPLDGSVIWLADEYGSVVEATWHKTRAWAGKWIDASRWCLWPGTRAVPFEPLGWHSHV